MYIASEAFVGEYLLWSLMLSFWQWLENGQRLQLLSVTSMMIAAYDPKLLLIYWTIFLFGWISISLARLYLCSRVCMCFKHEVSILFFVLLLCLMLFQLVGFLDSIFCKSWAIWWMQVLQMESDVLNHLKFEMTAPTAMCFLRSCLALFTISQTVFLLVWMLISGLWQFFRRFCSVVERTSCEVCISDLAASSCLIYTISRVFTCLGQWISDCQFLCDCR